MNQIQASLWRFFFSSFGWLKTGPIKLKNFNKSIFGDNFIKFSLLFAGRCPCRGEMTKCTRHQLWLCYAVLSCVWFFAEMPLYPMSQPCRDAVQWQFTCLNVMNFTNLFVDKMNERTGARQPANASETCWCFKCVIHVILATHSRNFFLTPFQTAKLRRSERDCWKKHRSQRRL